MYKYLSKYLSKLSFVFIALTTSPLFLLPATAEAKCVNYWINPATGKEECLGINSSYSRKNREIYDGVEFVEESDKTEKKFLIRPTVCGGYKVRLVDKDYEPKKRRLNTYWLGNRRNFSVLNSGNLLNSPRVKISPNSSNQRNRRERYQNPTNQQFKTDIQTDLNSNFQTSEVRKIKSCQNYYQPQGNGGEN